MLLGAVGFKFRTLTQEPLVGTPLSVCSVRGTEFTVFAAPEGSALYVVTDGLVDVESGGRSVSLSAGQGVRAEVGVALGEPFEVQRGWVKYEEFAADALARFDQDPLDALEAIRIDLVGYLEDAEAFAEALEVHSQDVAEARRRVKAVLDAQGEEQARELAEDILDPLYSNTLRLRLTFRHHVLSIRSLRRYVIAGLYVRTRVKTWADDENALWSSYKDAHDSLLELYEQRAVTLFEEEDL